MPTYNGNPISIPDVDYGVATDSIDVTLGLVPTSCVINATIEHGDMRDLILEMVHPTGVKVVFRDRYYNDDWGVAVDYDVTGAFGGLMPDGVWELRVTDLQGDGWWGDITQWSLTLETDEGLFARTEDAVAEFISPLVVSGSLTATTDCAAAFTGTVPAVGQIEASAGATMIATGLAGIDLISTARPRELYRCYIDSDLHGTTEIPIASAVVRQNAGGTGYLQVSMPDYARVSDIIQRAGDGRLRIDYVLEKEGREQATPFAQSVAIRVTQERGSRSRSVVITGTFALTSESPKTLELQSASYISDNGDTKRIRCQHNPRVSVGDTIYSNELPTGLVRSTVLTISSLGKQFEVTVQ